MRNACRLVLVLLLAATVTPAAGAGAKAKASTVQGKVTAATGDSLTIAKGSESMTFVVDNTTRIVSKGLTTKTNEKAAAGQKLTLSDAVANGDMVRVTYHDTNGKMHAGTIRVIQKTMSSK
jgi:hypothetical protein